MDSVLTAKPLVDLVELVDGLVEMRLDQIMLKTLLPKGWTIPLLCDAVIDGLLVPHGQELQEIIEWQVLRPEWIMARRVERTNLALLAGIQELTTEIRGIRTAGAKKSNGKKS